MAIRMRPLLPNTHHCTHSRRCARCDTPWLAHASAYTCSGTPTRARVRLAQRFRTHARVREDTCNAVQIGLVTSNGQLVSEPSSASYVDRPPLDSIAGIIRILMLVASTRITIIRTLLFRVCSIPERTAQDSARCLFVFFVVCLFFVCLFVCSFAFIRRVGWVDGQIHD